MQDGLARFSAVFKVNLPEVLGRLLAFLSDQVWPVFVEVISQPIIWLAVAALVFGSRVLSLAELWRKGQPYAQRAPGVSAFASYRQKQALRATGPPPRGIRVAGTEVKEAFFGDIDDKYLPAFHSLRLVLRAGLVFLGCVRAGLLDDRDGPELRRHPALHRHRRPRQRLLDHLGAADGSGAETAVASR